MSATPEATSPKPSPLASPEPWNLVVEGYEEIARKFLEVYSRSGLAMLRYGPQTKVIDVACGPGTTSLLLAPEVRHVTCLDFSAGMLAQLRRNMATIGATNVEIVEGDGQALPFEDNSFDVGVSMFGLMFFPDRTRGFAELHRVLVPGGQVLVSSWAPSDQSPMVRVVFAALQPDDAPQQPMSRLSGLEDRALFEKEMREAGFVDIRIEPMTHAIAVETSTGSGARRCAPWRRSRCSSATRARRIGRRSRPGRSTGYAMRFQCYRRSSRRRRIWRLAEGLEHMRVPL